MYNNATNTSGKEHEAMKSVSAIVFQFLELLLKYEDCT